MYKNIDEGTAEVTALYSKRQKLNSASQTDR